MSNFKINDEVKICKNGVASLLSRDTNEKFLDIITVSSNYN